MMPSAATFASSAFAQVGDTSILGIKAQHRLDPPVPDVDKMYLATHP
ncbi:hypothetical Protein YC6258_03598 [Gynuella sunshinyii YC6258]|uniref:Uncharacterized protein n=1 Tax=Gynuella sunshinyii YC6258 TaxID=1445510 RepID=A0A0C5VYY5_9GAMM|nr:hypothetical Protein YC6258_03598 [Gynuella sunshinyii YC6258]